jgi:hypothetical protein
MSRVDSVRIAIEKAKEFGHDLAGSVVASDAFFPFADGPQIALAAGATAIAQRADRSAMPRRWPPSMKQGRQWCSREGGYPALRGPTMDV